MYSALRWREKEIQMAKGWLQQRHALIPKCFVIQFYWHWLCAMSKWLNVYECKELTTYNILDWKKKAKTPILSVYWLLQPWCKWLDCSHPPQQWLEGRNVPQTSWAVLLGSGIIRQPWQWTILKNKTKQNERVAEKITEGFYLRNWLSGIQWVYRVL